MPSTIRINLNPKFNDAGTIQAIRERAAVIVTGSTDNDVIEPDARWSIDRMGNNWWFGWDKASATFSVQSRYTGDDVMIALKTILIWSFDLERFQPEQVSA